MFELVRGENFVLPRRFGGSASRRLSCLADFAYRRMSTRTQVRNRGRNQAGVMNSGPLVVGRHGVRRRDRVYQAITLATAVAAVPAALLVAPRRPLRRAGRWALAARFPRERLGGLAPTARDAFDDARASALWRHGQLIGLTCGYRTVEQQRALFAAAVAATGSVEAARRKVLPPEESRHVAGTAMDVRPMSGARWLETHGGRFGLYRVFDNEWWHFEFRPDGPPQRLPHPAAIGADRSRWPAAVQDQS